MVNIEVQYDIRDNTNKTLTRHQKNPQLAPSDPRHQSYTKKFLYGFLGKTKTQMSIPKRLGKKRKKKKQKINKFGSKVPSK